MFTKFALTIGAMAACVLLTSCGSSVHQDLGQTVEAFDLPSKTILNTEHGFEITIPGTWIVNEKSQSLFFQKTSVPLYKPHVGVDPSHTMIRRSPTGEIYDYTANLPLKRSETGNIYENMIARDESIYSKYSGYKVIEKTEIKICGSNGFKIAFELINESGLAIHLEFYYVLIDSRYFEFQTGTSKADHFKYGKEIDAIIRSFKLIKKVQD